MKHWIFDFDGTLVETDGLFKKTLGYALSPFKIHVDSQFLEKIRHKHPHNIFEDFLNKDQTQVAFERLHQASLEISGEIKIFPGMIDVLETISKAKGTLSIWTGRDFDSTDLILKKNGIDNVFQKISSGTCVENNKPKHDGLHEISNFHSSNWDEMVMIGDHHHDIEPANELGILSIHAQWKKNPISLHEKIKPNFQFGSIEDFHSWIKIKIQS